jgi:hypothetical protein
MANHFKTIGTVCIIAGVLYAIWGMIGMAYSVPVEAHQYRFDGVYAAEGTVLTVRDGQLVLIGGTNFSVDQPIRRIIDIGLNRFCFLMTMISGAVLLRLAKTKSNSVKITGKSEAGEIIVK